MGRYKKPGFTAASLSNFNAFQLIFSECTVIFFPPFFFRSVIHIWFYNTLACLQHHLHLPGSRLQNRRPLLQDTSHTVNHRHMYRRAKHWFEKLCNARCQQSAIPIHLICQKSSTLKPAKDLWPTSKPHSPLAEWRLCFVLPLGASYSENNWQIWALIPAAQLQPMLASEGDRGH